MINKDHVILKRKTKPVDNLKKKRIKRNLPSFKRCEAEKEQKMSRLDRKFDRNHQVRSDTRDKVDKVTFSYPSLFVDLQQKQFRVLC